MILSKKSSYDAISQELKMFYADFRKEVPLKPKNPH
jgi:hypothetical protein